ncbi:Gypsy retrotransposon integrase-like protein 1, partial [Elysia marginata]
MTSYASAVMVTVTRRSSARPSSRTRSRRKDGHNANNHPRLRVDMLQRHREPSSAVADHESDVDNNVLSHVTDLAQRQKEDPTLKPWFERLGKPAVHGVSFVLSDGLLFRKFYRQKSGLYDRTLVVPASLRNQVLSSAHDSSLSGHSEYRKTLTQIQSQFSWPGLTVDVKKFTQSCHVCQVKAPVGCDRPAPLQRMPIIEEPFQRVVIDLVGRLPVTSGKHEYIITMVDVATRWAEATPLLRTTAKDVADALFDIFTRVGFPQEIQSDRRQQFKSTLLKEFNAK